MRKYSPKIPIALDNNESNQFRQLINEKNLDLEEVKIKSITLRNDIEHQNFENFTIQAEYNELERNLTDLDLKISELRGYGESSVDSVKKKFEVENEHLKLDHQERLNQIKEDITKQVDKLLNDKRYKYEEQIKEYNQEIKRLVNGKKNSENELKEKLGELRKNQHAKEIEILDKLVSDTDNIKDEIKNMDQSITEKKQIIELIKTVQLEKLSTELSRFTAIRNQLMTKNNDKQTSIENLQLKIDNSLSATQSLAFKSDERSKNLHTLNFEIKRMKSEMIDQESKRRKLHAQLQDLKGNIRVFCRIRKVPSTDLLEYTIPQDINDDSKQELFIKKPHGKNELPYQFSFDKIFQPEQENKEVFEELSQLIQCSLDGTNVCVFAYGQTGSGKTFTMSHPENGMIPMSIVKIFDDIEDLKEKGWKYTVQGRFIEIYNESIIDLLGTSAGNKHEIKHDDATSKTTVTNITTIDISTPQQAIEILDHANKKRSTAATKANDHSSRSHSIFIIDIEGYNHITNEKCSGTLNLIDLAGSERLNNSKAEGDRLKETQAINKSLSCLGDVIYSLNLKDASHIPYRNSKLTYLLKNSLGGNSKTLMFVNISPMNKDFNETVNSLRFATKVNNTKLNK
ncbi:klp2 Kinesin-like protein 2 [Candida maltosa Xu316]|uniref:Kinesin-like protein n=1 Tax=Candida maltosa (strain Xu316) TaxID=1245528 RepID=M3J515_CANMX|nr:Kinesin-like protein, putative [Candida maltosa Xu316]